MPSKTHGESKTRLYRVWKGMRERCQNPNHESYHNYGGRGISVCEEWEKDFLAFKSWAIENGYDENAKTGECTLDRIDVDGNYCPNNCRFISASEQAKNKRNTIKIFYQGHDYCVEEFSKISGKTPNNIRRLFNLGLSADEIIHKELRVPKKLIFEGFEYEGPYELARHLGVNPRLFYERIHKGMSIDEALSKKIIEMGEMYEYNGEKHNLKQWAKILGINYVTLHARVKRYEWSLEDALSVPIDETCRKKRKMTEEEKQIVLNSTESAPRLAEKYGFSVYSVYKVRNEAKKEEEGVAS